MITIGKERVIQLSPIIFDFANNVIITCGYVQYLAICLYDFRDFEMININFWLWNSLLLYKAILFAEKQLSRCETHYMWCFYRIFYNKTLFVPFFTHLNIIYYFVSCVSLYEIFAKFYKHYRIYFKYYQR